MELTYLNGTPSQRADFDTAFGLVQLHYPQSKYMRVQVEVEWVVDPIPQMHNEYAGTTVGLARTDGPEGWRAAMKLRNDIWTGGVGFGQSQDVMIHELGHVVTHEILTQRPSAKAKFLASFGAQDADWNPQDRPWEARVLEGVAETFKDAIIGPGVLSRWAYNRTNWKIAQPGWRAWQEPFFDDYHAYQTAIGSGTGLPGGPAAPDAPLGYFVSRVGYDRSIGNGPHRDDPSDWAQRPMTYEWNVWGLGRAPLALSQATVTVRWWWQRPDVVVPDSAAWPILSQAPSGLLTLTPPTPDTFAFGRSFDWQVDIHSDDWAEWRAREDGPFVAQQKLTALYEMFPPWTPWDWPYPTAIAPGVVAAGPAPPGAHRHRRRVIAA